MRSPFVLPESLRFSDYATFNVGVETVLATLGYDFARDSLLLPAIALDALPNENRSYLRRRVESALRIVSFNSEMARREFLIAPVVLEAALMANAQLASEHPFDVSPRFHGSLDYLLQKSGVLVVIEAKNADMTRGFTQLSAEMIALDTFEEAGETPIYGAVTVGNLWQFGVLDRAQKRVTQDTNEFAVPDKLDELLAVLVGILGGVPGQ